MEQESGVRPAMKSYMKVVSIGAGDAITSIHIGALMSWIMDTSWGFSVLTVQCFVSRFL